MRESPIAAVDIARPDGGADALLAEECGARKQKDALAAVFRLPVILHAERMQQRKDIGVLGAVADGKLLVAQDGVAHVRPELFRLGAIEPEGVPSLRKQLAGQAVPIDVAPSALLGS
jgi:hypothetical protein